MITTTCAVNPVRNTLLVSRAASMATETGKRGQAVGCCDIRYLSETHFILKSRETSFAQSSVVKSFGNFAQSTVVSLPCSVQIFTTISQLRMMFWTNEISRDLSLSFGWIPYIMTSLLVPRGFLEMIDRPSNKIVQI